MDGAKSGAVNKWVLMGRWRRRGLFGLIELYVNKKKEWPRLAVIGKAIRLSTKRTCRQMQILQNEGKIRIHHFVSAPCIIEIPGVGSTLKTNVHKHQAKPRSTYRKEKTHGNTGRNRSRDQGTGRFVRFDQNIHSQAENVA